MAFINTPDIAGPLRVETVSDRTDYPKRLLTMAAMWVETTRSRWENWPYREVLTRARMGLIEEGIIQGGLFMESPGNPGARYFHGVFFQTSEGLFIMRSNSVDIGTLKSEGYVPREEPDEIKAKVLTSHMVDELVFFPEVLVLGKGKVGSYESGAVPALEIIVVGGEVQSCDVVQREIPVFDKPAITAGTMM